MKASASALFLAGLATSIAPAAGSAAFGAQQLAADSAPYAISMAAMREIKMQQREQDRAAGIFETNRYVAQGATKCSNGKAGEYSCRNVDLMGFIRHQDMGSGDREGNDVWGK